MIAIKKNNGVIRECDISDAILKKTLKGHVRENQEIAHEERRMVAVHEAAHALAAVAQNIPVQSVTIMSTTTGAGGLTLMAPQSQHYFRKSDYENRIRVSYAGRAGEELAFGVDMVTTGASQDIKDATRLIRTASSNYGFDLYDNKNHAPMIYKTIAQGNIEKAANKYYQETIQLLRENVVALKMIAKALIEDGSISGERVKEIYEENIGAEIPMK